jgi:translocation protein SEC63
LLLVWAYLGYISSIAATQTIEEILWSPYDILGVTESSTKAQIKSAFRKMAVKYHPDKVAKELQEESAKKYVEMTKAYKTLTNEDAKALWVCFELF